ncbi:hypothetical protein P4P77_000061 [Campylobacter jejuni]|nr:hypothetical protein [Campylobacter jejuni]HEG5908136.1 hypothetical protein [Campylobacter jejuni]
MKLKDFDFRIWNGKKYLKQKIYNDNINNNEYIAVTGNIDDENYVFTIEHGCERDYYGGDYDEYCKVKDFTSCNYEIELFTGFYDKNGKKIYEGDVIKYVYIFKHELLDKGMIKNLPKKVSIGCIGIDNFLGFRILKNKELQCFMKDIANIEIIGNIHENKELLNVRL